MANKDNKTCSQCGAPIDAKLQVCKYCGSEIEIQQTPQYTQVPQYTQSPQYTQAPQYNQAPQYGQAPQYNQRPQYRPGPQYSQQMAPGYYPYVDMKSKVAAGLLAIFLGSLGIHKFYTGHNAKGVLYLLFCWTYVPAIISFFEGIIYLTSSDEKFNMKYVKRK